MRRARRAAPRHAPHAARTTYATHATHATHDTRARTPHHATPHHRSTPHPVVGAMRVYFAARCASLVLPSGYHFPCMMLSTVGGATPGILGCVVGEVL